eukprot:9106341-Alexandrium_andersonii.AAC.1
MAPEEEAELRAARPRGAERVPSPSTSAGSRLHSPEAHRPSVPPGGAAKRRPSVPASVSPDSPLSTRACMGSGSATQQRVEVSGQAPRQAPVRAPAAVEPRTHATSHLPRTGRRGTTPELHQALHSRASGRRDGGSSRSEQTLGAHLREVSDVSLEGPARAGRALRASRPRAAFSSSEGSLSP